MAYNFRLAIGNVPDFRRSIESLRCQSNGNVRIDVAKDYGIELSVGSTSNGTAARMVLKNSFFKCQIPVERRLFVLHELLDNVPADERLYLLEISQSTTDLNLLQFRLQGFSGREKEFSIALVETDAERFPHTVISQKVVVRHVKLVDVIGDLAKARGSIEMAVKIQGQNYTIEWLNPKSIVQCYSLSLKAKLAIMQMPAESASLSFTFREQRGFIEFLLPVT